MKTIEYFPIVDETGNTIGKETRKKCHAGTFLLHPVVHLHIFNSKGELYLQKRSDKKDIQPGKWDTSVGGHVDFGEDIITALYRETKEELGITEFNPVFVLKYKFTSTQESELVHSYYCIFDGKIQPNVDEISEGKFWQISAIKTAFGKNIFTPNFEQEFLKLEPIFINII